MIVKGSTGLRPLRRLREPGHTRAKGPYGISANLLVPSGERCEAANAPVRDRLDQRRGVGIKLERHGADHHAGLYDGVERPPMGVVWNELAIHRALVDAATKLSTSDRLTPPEHPRVREARTGTEGWAQLSNEPLDVLLLDLKMPEMTGFELLDRISGDASLDAVPAIVLTSAILTLAERHRRAARIMSKSDLSGSALTGVIADVLEGFAPGGGMRAEPSPYP